MGTCQKVCQMTFEHCLVTARDQASGVSTEIGKLDDKASKSRTGPSRLVRPDGAPRSGSRVAAVPFPCAGLGRHDRRPQFRSRRVGSRAYARTSHCIRSGKRMMNPSRFGIRTLGNVSALSVSFSPMSLFAAKM